MSKHVAISPQEAADRLAIRELIKAKFLACVKSISMGEVAAGKAFAEAAGSARGIAECRPAFRTRRS